MEKDKGKLVLVLGILILFVSFFMVTIGFAADTRGTVYLPVVMKEYPVSWTMTSTITATATPTITPTATSTATPTGTATSTPTVTNTPYIKIP